MTLHCYCCGEPYERERYRCCAAPRGTPSHVWLGQHCTKCRPSPERTRCPRHCTCDKIEPIAKTIRPLAQMAKDAFAKLIPPEQRLKNLEEHIPDVVREYLPYADKD